MNWNEWIETNELNVKSVTQRDTTKKIKRKLFQGYTLTEYIPRTNRSTKKLETILYLIVRGNVAILKYGLMQIVIILMMLRTKIFSVRKINRKSKT